MKLIQPVQQHEALLADIADAQPGEGVCVWWLGQSGFLVKCEQGQVLFDPYLSDSLTKKYAETDKPHTRMTELAIRPGELRGIDVVTSTHNHTDHLDAETLQPLISTNPDIALVIPEANREFVAKRLDCPLDWPVGISDGESVTLNKIIVNAIPAAHNEIDRDDQGRCKYLGYVLQLGNTSIYHSGDTLLYSGMAEQLGKFDIDLAILPINGIRSERCVSGNLFGDEAAQLAHQISARLVVPCHYDMFTFNTEPPTLFVKSCQRLGQSHRVLRCGERLDLTEKA